MPNAAAFPQADDLPRRQPRGSSARGRIEPTDSPADSAAGPVSVLRAGDSNSMHLAVRVSPLQTRHRSRRSIHMGTWDVGPFDNDTAADWCGDLQDATPAQRPSMVRRALAAVIDNGDDYLDSDLAAEAIAAATVVASQLPGGAAITSSYAPDFLLEGGRIEVPGDVPALAVRALDRIVGDDSEWRELWEESEEGTSALATVQQIRTAIDTAVG
jgi:hypothetical protein